MNNVITIKFIYSDGTTKVKDTYGRFRGIRNPIDSTRPIDYETEANLELNQELLSDLYYVMQIDSVGAEKAKKATRELLWSQN